MTTDWNDRVRQIADDMYVKPAEHSRGTIEIRQGDLYLKARELGLPQGHANCIGTAVESPKFWRTRDLEMLTPRNQSRAKTTIYKFRFRDNDAGAFTISDHMTRASDSAETPEERAFRVTEKLRGLLKDEIASFGGAEAFMRWVRSDDEEAI